MGATPQTNSCSPSTRWVWKQVKMSRPPEANSDSAPKARRWYTLPALDWRRPFTIRVKYRGGAECWFEIHARGQIGRFPGHVSLYDAMREVAQQK